jgi:hypothetical protein
VPNRLAAEGASSTVWRHPGLRLSRELFPESPELAAGSGRLNPHRPGSGLTRFEFETGKLSACRSACPCRQKRRDAFEVAGLASRRATAGFEPGLELQQGVAFASKLGSTSSSRLAPVVGAPYPHGSSEAQTVRHVTSDGSGAS